MILFQVIYRYLALVTFCIDSFGYVHLLFNDNASTVRSFTSAAMATKKSISMVDLK